MEGEQLFTILRLWPFDCASVVWGYVCGGLEKGWRERGGHTIITHILKPVHIAVKCLQDNPKIA